MCLVHGNLSTARFFAATAQALPQSWLVAVPDLRGFGLSGPAPVDATRGVRDYAGDLDRVSPRSLVRTLYVRPPLRFPAEASLS